MESKYTFTPQQIFCLGTLMNASYIDYAYITAMGSIDENYSVFESKIRGELTNAGYLSESFSGKLTVNKDIQELLLPLFKGNAEIAIDVCSIGETTTMDSYKFHLLEDKVSESHFRNDAFDICEVSSERVMDIINSLLPEDYSAEVSVYDQEIDISQVTRIISVKAVVLNQLSTVKTYFEIDGVVYEESEDDVVTSLDRNTFMNECISMMQEVV